MSAKVCSNTWLKNSSESSKDVVLFFFPSVVVGNGDGTSWKQYAVCSFLLFMTTFFLSQTSSSFSQWDWIRLKPFFRSPRWGCNYQIFLFCLDTSEDGSVPCGSGHCRSGIVLLIPSQWGVKHPNQHNKKFSWDYTAHFSQRWICYWGQHNGTGKDDPVSLFSHRPPEWQYLTCMCYPGYQQMFGFDRSSVLRRIWQIRRSTDRQTERETSVVCSKA